MKKVFTIIISGAMFFANAQNFVCGTTEKTQEAIKADPSILDIEKALNDFTAQYALQPHKSTAGRDCPIIIPIVFHILHNFGPENISDAQVIDQVRILNDDYNKRNADTSDVVAAFKNIIGDIGIEFRLARLDPKGNPTNGIIRHAIMQTYNGNDNAKVDPWPRDKYLNVWVCKTMEDGVAGYAYLPATVAGYITSKDGIMILHNYIGSIGTSKPYNSRALTHEIGHYLNLQHTWGGSNQPGVACGDDGVNDTPITKGSNLSCNLNMNDCEIGTIENVQNYMDYSYCSRMFTEGQKDRMLATLNSMISSRRNLWDCANLTATGINDPYDPDPASKPIAAFGTTTLYTCVGSPVKFIDASYNGLREPSERLWEFGDDADIQSSTDSVVSVSYFTPGWKIVKLSVGNGYGSSTTIDSVAVYVSEGNVFHTAPYYENFEEPDAFDQWTSINYAHTPSYFQPTNIAARSGNHCYMINNYKLSRETDIEEIVSPAIDLSGLQDKTFSFYYSLASSDQYYADKSTDAIKVFASVNCGKTWLLLRSISGPQIVNGGYLLSNYVPNAGFYWKKELFTMQFQNNVNLSNVVFKIQYTSSNLSNNLYIDDINIGGVDVTGINETVLNNGVLNVFPNPSNGNTSLVFTSGTNENATIEIFDVSGKLVSTVYKGNINIGDNRFDFDKSTFPSTGVYFVKVKTASQVFGAKAIITE